MAGAGVGAGGVFNWGGYDPAKIPSSARQFTLGKYIITVDPYILGTSLLGSALTVYAGAVLAPALLVGAGAFEALHIYSAFGLMLGGYSLGAYFGVRIEEIPPAAYPP